MHMFIYVAENTANGVALKHANRHPAGGPGDTIVPTIHLADEPPELHTLRTTLSYLQYPSETTPDSQ